MPKARSWPRIVVHADMDAFYAAVEQLDDPKLREAQRQVELERERVLERKAALAAAHQDNEEKVARVAEQAEQRERLLAAIKQANRSEFYMVGGAGSLDAMELIKADNSVLKATVTYSPTMASSAVALARLVAQTKGMEDLVELQVPKLIILQSETITKDNVDKYMPLGFRS